jgi:putative intracellular protease/amidase
LSEFLQNGAVVAANCIAPALLAKAGAFNSVSDYQIVCYPGTEKNNVDDSHFVKSKKDQIHIHKNIITGNGPSSSVKLAHALATNLIGDSKIPDDVIKSMGY